MKLFNIQTNIGRVKYCVSFHDGQKTHKDGSPFFDISIFSNRRKMSSFISELKSKGFEQS